MIITSVNNDLIKETVKLKEKKYRDLTNTFLIEGLHLVNEAINNNLIKVIFVLEDFSFDTNFKKIIVSREVMKKLSDNPSLPKIMAIEEKKKEESIGNKVVILDRVQDPGNLGTIIRSATAFNFDTIILSNDSVDLYNSKVVRSTQGMLFNINILGRDIKGEITNLKSKNYLILGTDVYNGSDVSKYTVNKKFALVLGNEGTGVSEEVKSLCDDNLYIKMNSNCESLNVSVAASILMYELGSKYETY